MWQLQVQLSVRALLLKDLGKVSHTNARAVTKQLIWYQWYEHERSSIKGVYCSVLNRKGEVSGRFSLVTPVALPLLVGLQKVIQFVNNVCLLLPKSSRSGRGTYWEELARPGSPGNCC